MTRLSRGLRRRQDQHQARRLRSRTGRSSPTGRIPTRRCPPTRDCPYLRLDTERAWRFLSRRPEGGRRATIRSRRSRSRPTAPRASSSPTRASRCRRWTTSSTASARSTRPTTPSARRSRRVSPASSCARAQSRPADLLSRADVSGRIRRGARLPRLSAVLVLAAQRRHGDGSHLPRRPHRSLAPEGRAPVEPRREAGLDAALSADPPRLGDARARSGQRSRRRPAFRRRCGSSAARMIPTPRSFPISPRGATRSPCCRPAPGSSSWPSAARRRLDPSRPTCSPTSTCAGGPCRRRASCAGASSRCWPARRPPRRTRPTSPRSSPPGVMAMPAFTDQGGPFAGRKGYIEGEAPTTPAARAALATLYCALMSAHMLEAARGAGRPHRRGRLQPLARLRRRARRPEARPRGDGGAGFGRRRRRGSARPLGRASRPADAQTGGGVARSWAAGLSGAVGDIVVTAPAKETARKFLSESFGIPIEGRSSRRQPNDNLMASVQNLGARSTNPLFPRTNPLFRLLPRFSSSR